MKNKYVKTENLDHVKSDHLPKCCCLMKMKICNVNYKLKNYKIKNSREQISE